MIGIRHCGIYVKNISLEEEFYEKVFDMKYICRQEENRGDFDFLFHTEGTIVLITKLITERGVDTGYGDMIELIQVKRPVIETINVNHNLYDLGCMHTGIECDINEVLTKVIKCGGTVCTENVVMESGNSMCFIQDPEGNYIELIHREQLDGALTV